VHQDRDIEQRLGDARTLELRLTTVEQNVPAVGHVDTPRAASRTTGARRDREELRTVRDAMRELNRMIEALQTGATEKFVLTHRIQMRAVVVSIEDYAGMRRCLIERQAPAA
jgi:hypothetical protein